jgi:hypothetical protein
MNNSGNGIRWSAAQRAIPLQRAASDKIEYSVHDGEFALSLETDVVAVLNSTPNATGNNR